MRYSEVPHVDNGPRVHNTSPSRTQANRTPSASMWDKPPPPVEPAPQQPPPPVGPPPNDLPPPVNPPRNQSSSSNLHRPPPSSTLPPKPISNLPPKPTSFPQLPTSNKPMLTRKAYNRPSPPHSNSQEFLPTDMNKPTPPVSSNRNHGEPTQFPTPIVNTNVSASYTHPPKDLRVPLVSPATLPNGAGPRSPSQPIKVGIKRKYTEVNEIPDRGGERKAPEPPKSGDESSRSAASNPSEATRDRQLLVHVRRVAGELKKRETSM